jgi:hypothetical protein
MYYVKTETPDHVIISSYSTEKQARRYGGIPYVSEMYLLDGESGTFIEEEFNEEMETDATNIGLIRTVFRSKRDGKKTGNFRLYLQDAEGEWYYTGIFFASYSDANQAVKGPLSGTFGDMLIIENDEVVPTAKEESQIH